MTPQVPSSSVERTLAERYRLSSHIARGGMADVFSGEDTLLGRRVAVKILHGQFAGDDAFVERFRLEAQAAAALIHPNIVAVYDWGKDDDTYFMVMELVEGHTLRQIVRSEGSLLPRRVAEIGVEVAAALEVAHDVDIVHRDIKLANIMLTPEGRAKVGDFGIAHVLNDPSQLTKTGAVIGTATYFSPEQAQGLPLDGRSDIYSLGVVLYEIATGQAPFTGPSPVSVAYQHVTEPVRPPSEINPDIDVGLETVILKALAKDPADRYQSASEMRQDLERIVRGETPLASPINDAATMLFETAPAAGATGLLPPEALPAPSRSRTWIGALIGLLVFAGAAILLFMILRPAATVATVTIPEVSGQPAGTASEQLLNLDLRVIQRPEANPEFAAGFVIRTDPSAGTEVEEGALVDLIVSTGPANTSVPGVIGRDVADARKAITDAGLVVGRIDTEQSNDAQPGTVLSQDPAPDAAVAEGSEVDLVIASGPVVLAMPQLEGMEERQALFQLSQEGFTAEQIEVQREPSETVPLGVVISTIPGAGEPVATGEVVTLLVSAGAAPVEMPTVTGLSEEGAILTLEDLGLEVVVGDPIPLAFGDPDDGIVLAQDPLPFAEVAPGGTVTIQVGQAPAPVEVPDVFGRSAASAQNQIEAEGLTFVRGPDVSLPFNDPNDGKVVTQSPTAGEGVAPGSTVTVNVGVSPPPAFVPDVIEFTPTAARDAIEDAGLVYAQTTDTAVPFGDPRDGRVVTQSPSGSAAVAPGSTVTVSIGRAPPGTEVPNVIGRAQPGARQAIIQANLDHFWDQSDRCVVISQSQSDLEGRVAKQSIAPGTVVGEGTTVQIWIGRFEDEPCP